MKGLCQKVLRKDIVMDNILETFFKRQFFQMVWRIRTKLYMNLTFSIVNIAQFFLRKHCIPPNIITHKILKNK